MESLKNKPLVDGNPVVQATAMAICDQRSFQPHLINQNSAPTTLSHYTQVLHCTPGQEPRRHAKRARRRSGTGGIPKLAVAV
uniref:Uncharacterized protein n=1 Tax=Arundo donax TaxID=35708 RepID=A0A0A9DAJ2_ARUDO